MRLLTKYTLKEHFGPFFFGIGLFMFVFTADKLFQLTEMIITRGVPPAKVGLMLLWILPAIFAETAPIAWLLATLLAFSRMAQDNEVAPIRAAGQGYWIIARPALLAAGLLSLLLVWFNGTVLPYANWSFKELHFSIIRQRAAIIIQPHNFISEFDGHIFYVNEKDEATGLMQHVVVYRIPPDKPISAIVAERARLAFDPASRRVMLQLEDGEIHEVSSVHPERYRRMSFKGYDLDLDVHRALAKDEPGANRSFQEMTYGELRDTIARRTRQPDLSTVTPAMELHKRIAIPFACLAFGLVGFPFGVLVRRGGRGIGFTLSLAFTLVYYLLLVLGKTLGEKRLVDPWAAAWLPNLVLAAIGAIVLWRLTRSSR